MDFFHFLTQVYTYKQNTLTRQKVQPMHRSSIRGVEDMASLEDLHDGAIMHNLYLRYKQKYIYVSFLQAILDENNTVIESISSANLFLSLVKILHINMKTDHEFKLSWSAQQLTVPLMPFNASLT